MNPLEDATWRELWERERSGDTEAAAEIARRRRVAAESVAGLQRARELRAATDAALSGLRAWCRPAIGVRVVLDPPVRFDALPHKSAGVVVEIDGDEHLIGDVNELGGSCDCCKAIRYDDAVDAYTIVWRAGR